MADTYIQLPTDGSGKKVRSWSNTVGGESVHAQAFVLTHTDGTVLTDATGLLVSVVNATLDVSGSAVSVDDGGGSITVDGTFWQATQPVSIAAAVTVQDGGGSITVDGPLTDAELRASSVTTEQGIGLVVTGSGDAADETPIPSTDVSEYRQVTVAFDVGADVDGSVLFEQSVDNTNWTQMLTYSSSSGVYGLGAPVFDGDHSLYSAYLDARYFRVRIDSFSASFGVIDATAVFYRNAAPPPAQQVQVTASTALTATVHGYYAHQDAFDQFAPGDDAVAALGLTMVYNGTTWDRLRGDVTNGAFVNVKASVAIPVTDNGSTLSVDDGGGSLTVDGTFWQATQPVSLASVPSHDVTNAGTFAVQAAQSGTWNVGTVTTITNVVHVDDNGSTLSVDDGAGSLTVDNAQLSVVGSGTEATALRVTIATDSTGVLSVDDNGGSLTVDNGGTFVVQATLAAETTKVIGTVNQGTSPWVVSGAVTNTVLSVVGSGTEATAQRVTIATDSTGVLSVDDNGSSLTVDAPVGTPVFARLSDGSAALVAQKTMANSIPVVIASDQSALTVSSHAVTNAGTFAVQADTELTTADLDTGAGTDTRAVVGLVIAKSGGAANISTSDPLPISDAGGTLTVDAPVGTPAFVRLSDGSAAITTLAVSLASVPSHAVTNAGTFAVQESGTQVLVDNAGFTDGTSKVVTAGFIYDDVAGTALTENDVAAGRVNANRALVSTIEDGSTRARYATVTASNALKVDASAVAVPVTDNSGSLTIDNAQLSVVGSGTEATALRVTIATDSTGVLSVDDNGGSLTVDNGGTFAVQAVAAGDVAAGASDSGNPVKIGGRYGPTLPTLGVNQRGDVRLDDRSRVIVRLHTATGAVPELQASDNSGTDLGLLVSSQNMVSTGTSYYPQRMAPSADAQATSGIASAALMGFNGSTWDRVRTANTGRLQVDVVTAASTAVTNAGTFAVQATLAAETTKVIGTVNIAASQTIAVTNTGTFAVQAAGDVAAGASDSGNPVKVGAKYLSVKPTLTNGLRGDLQVGTRGSLAVQLQMPDSTAGVFVTEGDTNAGFAGIMTMMEGTANSAFNLSAMAVGAGGQTNNSAILAAGMTIKDATNGYHALAYPQNDVMTQGLAGAANMGWNASGSVWERLRVANTGRLQVDVVTAPSTAVTNAGTFAVQAVGNVASGAADSGAPVKIGGIYSATQPTLTDLQRGNAQLDTRGNLKVTMMALDAATAASIGGGTEYTEGDTDASITGHAILWEDASDTLRAVSAAKPLPISDASGSLTVDAPVGTPAFVRLSDGAAAITTLPVSLASVPSHDVTNAGTFAVQATLTAETTKVIGTVNQGTSPWVVQAAGDVASGAADSGNPVKAGAVYHVTDTEYDDGDRVDLQSDVYGRLKVYVGSTTVDGEERTIVYDEAAETATHDTHVLLRAVILRLDILNSAIHNRYSPPDEYGEM